MPRAKGSYAPYCWAEKPFASDISPGKRALATELQRLCRLLALEPDGSAPTQKQAAARLHVSETSLSRYLSGKYLPGQAVLRTIHTAVDGIEGADVTLSHLEKLHAAADAEQCRACVELRRQVTAGAVELGSTRAERDAAQQEASALHKRATALKHQVRALEAREGRALKRTARRAIRAGQRSRQSARQDAALLPVPRSKGDRQQRIPEMRAALHVARQAGDLQSSGRQDGALSLLRQSAEVISPAETATLVHVLRETQLDDLASTLIHIYGRDNSDPDVMRAAAHLHQNGNPDDAAALLQAALTTRTGTS
ncbi:helix-turn-helix transcriptional regulator [Streptomyces sp. NPDC007084]|uniref:helix-turn-helix domain-containing protein n=1 Tax=Streptomyces sp. NPDC007084 TaxID=3154313 RepID=UPI0034539C03